MDKWTSTFSPSSLHGLHSPIWIRLPQLPLIYWDINNITRIANGIGEPLWMDSHTSTWGKSSFARICVRINLEQKLIPGVWINGIHGKFFQRIEYEGLFNFCFDCGYLGHAKGNCPSLGKTSGPSPSSGRATQATHAATKEQPVQAPPTRTEQPIRNDPQECEEPDEDSLGTWNIVTRKRRGKNKAPAAAPSKGRDGVTEPSQATPTPENTQQRMEEISERIVNPRKSPTMNQRVSFNAARSGQDQTPTTVDLSKRQHKASRAFMEKQLLQLGPIATLPRKRRKNLQDDTGGDFVPFEDQ
ncbi:hypothetical protein KFK09_004003 [Dendrobium nobile]|uniref:CCHC-type domain-containing protein n=1 Tax=Dendrobium nobile TaxID=94219 RepID=A0A8T3BZ85_DENNO|nr:hypothetical protein KFK09_004003 [Dendrobium nobile]